jgi:chemotaxis family two-component system response regulator Rcp1
MRTATPSRRPFEVALVEDSRQESWLILEAMKKDRRKLNIAVLPDGERASDYLQRRDSGEAAFYRRPDLIILDLSIPRKDGFCLLAELRDSSELKDVPVVVFTGHEDLEEINRCYALGANCVLTKPAEMERYIDMVRAVEHYWLDVVGR